MTDELVAYLLDDLPAERRAAVEAQLAADPAWRSELERLTECLAATTDPALCVDEPPTDLVVRTCGLVERADSGCGAGRDLSRTSGATAALMSEVVPNGGMRRWSWADCTVGAGVLAMVGMLVLPAMRESRDAARRVVCQDKMRALGEVFYGYQSAHKKRLPAPSLGEPTGLFIIELADRTGSDRGEFVQLWVCPESQEAAQLFEQRLGASVPESVELATADGARVKAMLQRLPVSLAYRLGYFGPDHKYYAQRYTGDESEPLCADAPYLVRSTPRVKNHGGLGQNVLDQGMGVKFLTSFLLTPEGDNMFLNAWGLPAAGHDPSDVVLAGPKTMPEGPMDEVSRW